MRGSKMLGLIAIAIALISSSAMGQTNYPDKPIRLVVAYAAGGTTDIIARLIGERLGKMLNQTVVVNNLPGASGMIGTSQVAKSTPDGYTVLLAASGEVASNAALFASMPYDPVRDLSPVIQFGSVHIAFVTGSSSNIKSVADLIERAKKSKTSQPTYGTLGVGTTTQLVGELLNQAAGTALTHVPYKGGAAPLLNDLLGGHVDTGFTGVSNVLPYLADGSIRVLAVAAPKRSAVVPSVPTFAELGYPDVALEQWFSVWVPAGTPRPIVDKLNKDVAHVVSQQEFKDTLLKLGVDTFVGTPEDLRRVQEQDIARYRSIATKAGIKPQ